MNGPLIRLWKVNPNNSPKLPIGVQGFVLYHPIEGNDALRLVEKEKFISSRLLKYVNFWKVGIMQSSTYEMKMKSYVKYREKNLLHLSRPLSPQCTTFWRGSGLQVIGGLIMLKFHCQPWWTLLIQKIQFEILIMSQRT
jgi:hypothetical protein